MPTRSKKTLGRVVDLLADRLQPHFHFMLQRHDVLLRTRLADEADPARLDDWMDSRQALALRGNLFFPAFIASLREGCLSAFDHSPPPQPAGPFRDLDQPLTLVDEAVIDEDSVLAGLAARLEARASHALMLLSQRVAVLLERPPLPSNELPVGPHAFCRALQQGARETGLSLHGRIALYELYEEDSGMRFEPTMESVDSLLDSMGILPGLTYVPLRRQRVPAHPERGRGHAPEPGLVAEIVAMRTVNEALDATVPAGLLPDHRLGERHEAVSAMVRLVSRHGPESDTWQHCREVMGEVIEATRERRPVRPGTAEWIRTTLVDLGYSEVECRRLSEALVHLGQDIANVARAQPAGQAAPRSQGLAPGKDSNASANAGHG